MVLATLLLVVMVAAVLIVVVLVLVVVLIVVAAVVVVVSSCNAGGRDCVSPCNDGDGCCADGGGDGGNSGVDCFPSISFFPTLYHSLTRDDSCRLLTNHSPPTLCPLSPLGRRVPLLPRLLFSLFRFLLRKAVSVPHLGISSRQYKVQAGYHNSLQTCKNQQMSLCI